MEYTQFIKWSDEAVTKYKYSNHSKEELVEMLKQDIHDRGILSTWLEDENGKELAYFDRNNEITKGEENMKKGTKEEVLNEVFDEVAVEHWDIEDVLDVLEEHRYIEFKEEYKEYKVFVKTVITYEGVKDLYYVTDSIYTDNIDEAKLFELDEEKDGYSYEIVKESV